MVNSRYSFDSDEKAYKSWRDDALGQDNKKLLYNKQIELIFLNWFGQSIKKVSLLFH